MPSSHDSAAVQFDGQPDEHFSAADQQRLADLMDLWRSSRDQGKILPQPLQRELDALAEAELRASTVRTQAMLDSLLPNGDTEAWHGK